MKKALYFASIILVSSLAISCGDSDPKANEFPPELAKCINQAFEHQFAWQILLDFERKMIEAGDLESASDSSYAKLYQNSLKNQGIVINAKYDVALIHKSIASTPKELAALIEKVNVCSQPAAGTKIFDRHFAHFVALFSLYCLAEEEGVEPERPEALDTIAPPPL